MSRKKIIVTSGWNAFGGDKPWRVEQVENSLAYTPGQFLDEQEMQHLLAGNSWRVVVKAKHGGGK